MWMIAPVEVAPKVIVPEPAASMVKFSFVPEVMTDRATPAAAAADLILRPVAEEAVEASTRKAGLVAPLRPTARAVAEAEVIVWAPPVRRVENSVPVLGLKVSLVEDTFCDWFPDAVVTHVGNMVALVVVSSVMVVAVATAEVIEVLQPKPVFVVQIRAEEAVEQEPTARAVGEAEPAVALPRTVLVAWVARSARATEAKVGAPAALPWRTVVVVPREARTTGVAPAPPPRTIALAVRAIEEARVPAAVKPRTPPEVPEARPVPPRATESWPDQPTVMEVAVTKAEAGVPPRVRVTLVSSTLIRAAPVMPMLMLPAATEQVIGATGVQEITAEPADQDGSAATLFWR